MVQYLSSLGIKAHAFYTDDVAHEMREPMLWVSTLAPADNFFVSRKCDMLGEALSSEHIRFPEIYESIIAKSEVPPNITDEARLEFVIKHSSKAVSKILPKYKLIVHFVKRNNAQYKVLTKPGDGRVVINIDADSFTPTIFMSGSPVEPVSFLERADGNLPVYNWKGVDE